LCTTVCCLFYVNENINIFHGNNKWWNSGCANPDVDNEIQITIQLSSSNPNFHTGREKAGRMGMTQAIFHFQ